MTRQNARPRGAHPPGQARLYRMPAERALAAIPAGSISVLLTDPPYTSVNRQGGSGSHLQHWFPGGLSWTEIGRILAVARRGPGDVVLDPFVGSGALLVGARERGAHVIGCDIAPAALRVAKAKLGSG